MKVMTIVAFVECPLKELWPIILCSIYTYIKLNTNTHTHTHPLKNKKILCSIYDFIYTYHKTYGFLAIFSQLM